MMNYVKCDLNQCINFSNDIHDIDRKSKIQTSIKQESVKEEGDIDLSSSILHESERVETDEEFIKVEPEFESFSEDQISDAKYGSPRMTEFVGVQYMKEEYTEEHNNTEDSSDPIKLNEGKEIIVKPK